MVVSNRCTGTICHALLQFSTHRLTRASAIVFATIRHSKTRGSRKRTIRNRGKRTIPLRGPRFSPVFEIAIVHQLDSNQRIVNLRRLLQSPPILILIRLMRRVIIKIVRIDQGTLANQILQISRQINQFVVGVRRAYLIIVPKHRPSVITPRCRNQTGNTSGRICVSEEESMPRRRAITVVDFNKATLCEST